MSEKDPSNEELQPTQDELVAQLEESEQDERGPNEELRRHIELYSKYAPVIFGFLHAIVGAMIIPVFLAYFWYELRPAFDLSQLRGAVYRSLGELIPSLFVCLVLYRCLRPRRFAEARLGWAESVCSGLRLIVQTVMWFWLPMRFAYLGLETLNEGKWNDSLGRLLFIVAMVGTAAGFFVGCKRLRGWLQERTEGSVRTTGLGRLLLWLVPLAPLTLAVLAIIGFDFAAAELSWRLLYSTLFIISMAILTGFASRLLLITQFGIKLRELSRDEDGEIHNDESIDIREITQQVNRLLRATTLVLIVIFSWQLWSPVFPAIGYLDEVNLWHSTTGVDIDGVKPWITLRHLLMGIGLSFITYILSRNLPGLLEITLLDRLPLDRGGRYAISFVLKYVVAIAGFLAVCQVIGFSWSNVQWLAAALTFGLGFGLQEIFGNLVSGIIILIERPIRIGDVVTVNGVTGTVTRMQLRATTIKDFDFRELIVPNKKFITEDVMNWTLTDRRSRVIHKIGVAYGSDTKLVHETLMKVARRHPLVQVEPPPKVFFKGFGDSTLDFELCVFIPTREIFLQVQHELNMAIDSEFRAKGIEIAFPQQDIYIKNLNELPTGNSNANSDAA